MSTSHPYAVETQSSNEIADEIAKAVRLATRAIDHLSGSNDEIDKLSDGVLARKVVDGKKLQKSAAQGARPHEIQLDAINLLSALAARARVADPGAGF